MALGLVSTGYGAQTPSKNNGQKQQPNNGQTTARQRSKTTPPPPLMSKIQLGQIQSVNATTFQQGQFQSLVDPLNKSLKKNQEIIQI